MGGAIIKIDVDTQKQLQEAINTEIKLAREKGLYLRKLYVSQKKDAEGYDGTIFIHT